MLTTFEVKASMVLTWAIMVIVALSLVTIDPTNAIVHAVAAVVSAYFLGSEVAR